MTIKKLNNTATEIAEFFEELRIDLTNGDGGSFLYARLTPDGKVETGHIISADSTRDVAALLGAVRMLELSLTDCIRKG